MQVYTISIFQVSSGMSLYRGVDMLRRPRDFFNPNGGAKGMPREPCWFQAQGSGRYPNPAELRVGALGAHSRVLRPLLGQTKAGSGA